MVVMKLKWKITSEPEWKRVTSTFAARWECMAAVTDDLKPIATSVLASRAKNIQPKRSPRSKTPASTDPDARSAKSVPRLFDHRVNKLGFIEFIHMMYMSVTLSVTAINLAKTLNSINYFHFEDPVGTGKHRLAENVAPAVFHPIISMGELFVNVNE